MARKERRTRQRGNGAGSLFQRDGCGPWVGSYYDHNGQRREKSTKTTDKRAAERILGKWVTEANLRREGVIDARAESLAEQTRQPVAKHLVDFKASLLAKGGTVRHVELVLARVTRVMEGAGFETWADVSGSRAMEFIRGLRADVEIRDEAGQVVKTKRGISAQTFNFHLGAIKQFGRWMVKDRRASDNPFSYLEPLNVKLDRRHDRRALKPDELRTLIAVTEAGPDRYGMTGKARAVMYRLAVETGLRAGELRSLTRASFHLEGDSPTVTVAAGYSKHRREDVLPIRPALAELLKSHLVNKAPAASAFDAPDDRRDFSDLFQADREAAGIVYRDDAGRVCDFHALRHSFVSNLVAGGVHPKTAQSLARHGTIGLTMDRYAHRLVDNDAEALNVLPDLTIPAVSEATGTDGRAVTVDEGARSRARSSRADRRGADASRRDETANNSQLPGRADGARNRLEDTELREVVRDDAVRCESEAEGFEPNGHSINTCGTMGYDRRFRFLEKSLDAKCVPRISLLAVPCAAACHAVSTTVPPLPELANASGISAVRPRSPPLPSHQSLDTTKSDKGDGPIYAAC